MKISDIAKLANVSKAAVSLALNNKPGISDETRAKILKIVKDTGYLPKCMVKADQYYGKVKSLLFLACTNNDIVSPQYHSAPFFMELIHDLEEQCRTLGYSLSFYTIGPETLTEEIERLSRENASVGTILLGTNLSDKEVVNILKYQPNLVVLDNYLEYSNVDCIVMDNTYGAYTAGSYLIGLGHKNIGYVQSHTRINNFNLRKRGFGAALSEHDISINECNVFSVPPFIESAQTEFKEILRGRKIAMPSALFCENDYIAIGIIKALQESGYKVPDDISVIGFDNISQATIITPELTTIHVDKMKMASLTIKRLVELIESGGHVKTKTCITTELIERKSCAPYND